MNREDFLRDDIKTYTPKFRLFLPMCKVEVRRFSVESNFDIK